MAKYLNTQHIIFLKNENNKNKVFSFFSTYQGFFARQQEFTINMRFFFSLNTKPLTNSQLSYSITFITKNLYFFLRLYFLFLNSKKKKGTGFAKCRQNVTHWRCKSPLFYSNVYLFSNNGEKENVSSLLMNHLILPTLQQLFFLIKQFLRWIQE